MLTLILFAIYFLVVLVVGFGELKRHPDALDPKTLFFWVVLFVTAPFAALYPFVLLVQWIGAKSEALNRWALSQVVKLAARWSPQ